MPIPSRIEKCKGAMLGTAIGDALGWPNEPRAKNRKKRIEVTDHFVEWTRSSNNPHWYDEKILPGEYSDDTQLTLSVARSIITGDWERFLAEKELPFWLRYERGGGGALLKAAKTLKGDTGLGSLTMRGIISMRVETGRRCESCLTSLHRQKSLILKN